MKARSIRVRLTAWYLAILLPATLGLAGTGWWLVRRSVIDAADTGLRTRIDHVRAFIAAGEAALSRDEVHDEVCEYVQLSSGEALLAVTSDSGRVQCQPALTGWADLDIGGSLVASTTVSIAPRELRGRPIRVAGITFDGRNDRYHVLVGTPMGTAFDALARFKWVLILLVPAVLIAAGAGGYWIAGRALAPVDAMTRDVQAITVRNLDRRLDVPAGDDELRRLALTFNDMVARMQASVAEMTRLTAEASHELRTPVALVRATADVALSRERSAVEYRDALQDVLVEAERMSVLVDDLLTLARADARVEPIETASIDARDLVAESVRGAQAAIARGGLVVDVDLPPAAVPITGSPSSLRRLMATLLENAVKYTPAGGRIRTRVVREPGAAVVEVSDTGIGIDPADAPRVFERFYRGAAAREYAATGSGLGLSIARTIVERYGGDIAIGPGDAGKGCRVRVTFADRG